MPCNRLRAHSLTQFTGSLSQFEIIALRSLGRAPLRVCNLWNLDFMRLIVYGSIHDWGTFVWKDIGSKPQVFRPCLGQSRVSDIRAADVSRPDTRRRSCDCLRDTLDVPGRGTGSCP